MRDLERIRYVAANYGRLQGLRKLPVGLFFLLWVAALVSTLVWTRTLEDTVVPAGYVYAVLCLVVMIFVGSVLLYDRIGVYYERRYGSVERFSRVPARRKALYAAIVLAVVLGSSFGLLVLGVAMRSRTGPSAVSRRTTWRWRRSWWATACSIWWAWS